MRADIEKIIHYGTLAPSGDNSQPWRFKIRNNNTIELYRFPERDTSVYNSHNASIHTAHGAVIENMLVAARDLGYGTELRLFPEPQNPDLTASLVLNQATGPKSQETVNLGIIEKRCTNRKPYSPERIPTEIIKKLEQSFNDLNYGRLVLIGKPEEIAKISKPLSYNEKFALETKEIHNFLFHHLTWTEKEQKEKKIGMGMKTLELKFPKTLIFRLLRFWPLMNFLNKTIRASNLIAKDNEKIFKRSALIGTIVSLGDGKEDIINTGRAMQRIWLKATENGLNLQLLTGIGFFHFKLRKNDPEPFDKKQLELISKSYKDIAEIIGVNQKEEIFLVSFRLGYGGEPTERCYRLPPVIDWI